MNPNILSQHLPTKPTLNQQVLKNNLYQMAPPFVQHVLELTTEYLQILQDIGIKLKEL